MIMPWSPDVVIIRRANGIVKKSNSRELAELKRELADFRSVRDGIELDLMIERSGEAGERVRAIRNALLAA